MFESFWDSIDAGFGGKVIQELLCSTDAYGINGVTVGVEKCFGMGWFKGKTCEVFLAKDNNDFIAKFFVRSGSAGRFARFAVDNEIDGGNCCACAIKRGSKGNFFWILGGRICILIGLTGSGCIGVEVLICETLTLFDVINLDKQLFTFWVIVVVVVVAAFDVHEDVSSNFSVGIGFKKHDVGVDDVELLEAFEDVCVIKIEIE